MESIKISIFYSNREESVYIHNLEELSSWIDDFGTDHCERSCKLYMFLDSARQYVPVSIYCEKGNA